jgi:hypothetical protein
VIDAQSIVIDRHRDGTQTVNLKHLKRAGIGGRLDDDLITRFGQRLSDERDALRRAGQHQHVPRVDPGTAGAHSLGDRLAQRSVTFAIAVGQDEVHVAADPRERPRQIRERRRLGGRHTLDERDAVAAADSGEFTQHRGKLAHAPRRQRYPPRNGGSALGLRRPQ